MSLRGNNIEETSLITHIGFSQNLNIITYLLTYSKVQDII
jgi:hypothetical protein